MRKRMAWIWAEGISKVEVVYLRERESWRQALPRNIARNIGSLPLVIKLLRRPICFPRHKVSTLTFSVIMLDEYEYMIFQKLNVV
jgi:hypothetical protein